MAPTLGKAKISVVKSPVAPPSETPLGVSFVGCACTAEVGSEGVLFFFLGVLTSGPGLCSEAVLRAGLAGVGRTNSLLPFYNVRAGLVP